MLQVPILAKLTEIRAPETAAVELRTKHFGEWCNGSTADSGSACLGSNPSSPAS